MGLGEPAFSHYQGITTPPGHCWLCRQPLLSASGAFLMTTRDHVIPRSRGGAQGPTRLAHDCCNRWRSSHEVTSQLVGAIQWHFKRLVLRLYSEPPRRVRVCPFSGLVLELEYHPTQRVNMRYYRVLRELK